MHHGPEFTVVFLVCVTLALGALMRLIGGRIRVPYTIAILLLGLGAGFALKQVHEEIDVLAILERGKHIRPDLIIFAFLPALVFESSYALDVHAFRKNAGAVVLLAGPALVVSTVLTGLVMVLLTRSSWEWTLTEALVFGALISATDPVAVVAILRECGAPKRLGVLIEGESLLNDGTSIVVFQVMLAVLIEGGWSNVTAGGTTLDFLITVTGGIGVGLGLALIACWLVDRTFNDPMVEITVTLIIAYASMVIAEGLLHVSGVMAVVTAGLWMGGPGRTHISPEVHHFLHKFWEMLAYIANTLIFFLVGLVVAAQVERARLIDLLLVLAAYVAVMVLRFLITFAFGPLIRMVGDPVSKAEATVMSWGGLRGAVSLALALFVSQHPDIPPALREQVLLVTAGVVLLTILLNGSTTGRLLAMMGFAKPPLAEQVAQLTARASVLHEVEERIDAVSQSRDLRTVSWDEVEKDISQRRALIDTDLTKVRRELVSATGAERAVGFWQQALSIERQAYWWAFAHGTLDPMAARILDREIDVQLDRLAKGGAHAPATRTPAIRGLRGAFARWMQKSGRQFGAVQFGHLSLLYNLSRGEALAAEKVLSELGKLKGIDPDVLEEIRTTYQGYLMAGKERLEDMRSNLPEITRAIETRLAKRIQLNFEREGYEHLAHRGAIDEDVANKALDTVEREMKRLLARPREVELPETADLVRTAPMFSGLDEAALKHLADITLEQVLSPGEVLFREGAKGDSMFIVARGAMHVIKTINGDERVVTVLGGGDILGEMSLLTGEPRTATIRAATTVTVGKINREDFEHLMDTQPDVRQGVWACFARARFDNFLLGIKRYGHLDREARTGWFEQGTHIELKAGDVIDWGDAAHVFLATGSVEVGGVERSAPILLDTEKDAVFRATAETRAVLIPARQIEDEEA